MTGRYRGGKQRAIRAMLAAEGITTDDDLVIPHDDTDERIGHPSDDTLAGLASELFMKGYRSWDLPLIERTYGQSTGGRYRSYIRGMDGADIRRLLVMMRRLDACDPYSIPGLSRVRTDLYRYRGKDVWLDIWYEGGHADIYIGGRSVTDARARLAGTCVWPIAPEDLARWLDEHWPRS